MVERGLDDVSRGDQLDGVQRFHGR